MIDYLKGMIIHQIKLNGGISNQRLWINMTSMDNKFTTQEYHNALDDLIRDKEVIKLEFSDSATYGRNRQVFFLRGTRFMNLKDFVRASDESSEETDTSKSQLVNKSSPDV